MALPPNLTVHVKLDDVQAILDEIKELTTYSNPWTGELDLVRRSEVAQILARHVKVTREG